MKSLIALVVTVIVSGLLLALLTEYHPAADSQVMVSTTSVFGLPVVSYAQTGARGWLAVGQEARGVVVIAQLGRGLVAFAQGGVGLLFGIGQGMVGLACIAQIGFGPLFFLGQMGVGVQAAGQGVFRRRPGDYFKQMGEEFDELLRPPSRRLARALLG